MIRKKVSGFTLIELMVVIVIIGVLASLAIPRFTEASDKAKAAEAPRILASYESAQLAHVAEKGWVGAASIVEDDNSLIFNLNAIGDSKWFSYSATGGAGPVATAPNGDEASLDAGPKGSIGKWLAATRITLAVNNQGEVARSGTTTTTIKLIPNFRDQAFQ